MNGKIFRLQNCFNLCSNWVTFQDPPQENFGPPPIQRNLPFSLDDDDEDPNGSNSTPTSTPDCLPRPMGQNTTRRKQVKGKEKEDKAFQDRLLANMERIAEENAKAEEAKAIREKMKEDRREKERLEAIVMMQTMNFSPISKAYFDGKKREAIESLNARATRELFLNSDSTSNDYCPGMASEDDE